MGPGGFEHVTGTGRWKNFFGPREVRTLEKLSGPPLFHIHFPFPVAAAGATKAYVVNFKFIWGDVADPDTLIFQTAPEKVFLVGFWGPNISSPGVWKPRDIV